MPLQRPLLDFDAIRTVHSRKRLQLATSVGLQGFMDLNGDPHALVDELIRLACIGQHCEQLAFTAPTRMVSHAVEESK